MKIGRVRAFAVSVVLVSLLVGCTDGSEPGPPSDDAGTGVERVVRTDLDSVVTLGAHVVTNATVAIAAPTAGSQIRFSSRSTVPAGEPVLSYVSHGKRLPVTLPAQIRIAKRYVSNGAASPAGLPLADVIVNDFAVQARVSGALLFRFRKGVISAQAQIGDGPGPDACTIIGATTRMDEAFTLTCLPRHARELVDGLDAVMAVKNGSRRGVLTLPLTAVAGAADEGVVNLKAGSGFKRTPVQLGLSDGVRVEIKTGLRENDEVSALAPNLTYPAPNSGR